MVQLFESVCRIKLFNSPLFFALICGLIMSLQCIEEIHSGLKNQIVFFQKNKKITSAIAIFLCIATFLYVKNVLLIFALN